MYRLHNLTDTLAFTKKFKMRQKSFVTFARCDDFKQDKKSELISTLLHEFLTYMSNSERGVGRKRETDMQRYRQTDRQVARQK